MKSNLRRTFLIVNYIALCFAPVAGVFVSLIATVGGTGRVVELDRMGGFNEQAIANYHPYLAEDLRNHVGRWIQEPVLNFGLFPLACAFGGLAAMNIVGFHLLNKFDPKPQRPPDHMLQRLAFGRR